jgi:cathepsin B
MKFFCLLLLISFALAFNDQAMVDHINGLKTSWTAGLNRGSSIYGATKDQVKAMLGARKGGPKLPRKTIFEADPKAVPAAFDSATNWPQCATMKVIRDQSACGTCWAFGAVEAMSDRNCIFLNKNISLSSADLAFCCDSCGDGCNGGYPGAAWQYWVDTGIVEEGCWPYPFPSCDHHIPNSKNPCPPNEYPSASCQGSCSSSWQGPSWNNDLHYGGTAYSVSGEEDIKAEIF